MPNPLLGALALIATQIPPASRQNDLPPPQPMDLVTEFPAALGEILRERVEEDRFSGVVLVAKDGEPIFAEAHGMADKEAGRELTLDTPMGLASMNKMFTGVAIAQLAARGDLLFDDVVGDHLPDYPNEEVAARVTIHHLLTHTAGLGLYFRNPIYWETKDKYRTHTEFLELFADESPAFEPGARMEYSNNGPVVLGLVIEAITGQSYYDYVRQNIYQPAGMAHTDHYLLEEQDTAAFAAAYVRESEDSPWESDRPMKGPRGNAAGGGYSSANDLLRFSRAIFAGRLLDEEHWELLWKWHVDEGREQGYGYLWGHQRIAGVRSTGHNGGGGGVNTDFAIFPDHGYTTIVLANYQQAARPITGWIRTTLSLSLAEE